MRKLIAIILTACMALPLLACGHEHVWAEATCTTPKTCTECGTTEGEALGHTWQEATCTEPRTCTVCGATEGEALGHTWQEATCTEPRTCTVCGATEGKALGHTWQEATCSKPKTCTVCGATEGEALGHSWIEATYSSPKTCSRCGETEGQRKAAFFEENNVSVAGKLNNLSINAVAVDRENNPTKIEFPDTKISVKSNSVAPSNSRMDYSSYTLIYELRCVAPRFANGYGVDMGNICDYYTGYVFEDRATYGTDAFELHDSVILDGVKYDIFYTKNVKWGNWAWSAADNGAVSTVKVTYTIEVPNEYDGLLLFFENQTEWVAFEDNDSIKSYHLNPSELSNKVFFHVN